jgi:Na+/citrate or Na+/malate symporter
LASSPVLLLAVHTVQEQTGKALDLLQFMAAFITGLINSGGGGYGTMAITEATAQGELPSIFAG